jgi:hypothetical protein
MAIEFKFTGQIDARTVEVTGDQAFAEKWPDVLRSDQNEALAEDVAFTEFNINTRTPVQLNLGAKRYTTRAPAPIIRKEMKLASRFLIRGGGAGVPEDEQAVVNAMIEALQWLYRRCIKQTTGPRAKRTRKNYAYMVEGRVVGKNIGVVRRLINSGSIVGVTNQNRLAVIDEVPKRIAAIPFPYYDKNKKDGIGVRGAYVSYQPMWKAYLATKRRFGVVSGRGVVPKAQAPQGYPLDFRFRFQKPHLVGQPRVANKPPMDAPVVELSNFGQMGSNTGEQWIKRRYQEPLGRRYLSLLRKR